DGADLPAAARPLDGLGDCRKGLGPGRRLQPAALADVRPVEALTLEAVPDEAGLVGNPFLVDGVVDARQDAHHFPAAAVDANVGADGVHYVDGFSLGELPGTRSESVGLAGERAHRAEIDDVALDLAGQ